MKMLNKKERIYHYNALESFACDPEFSKAVLYNFGLCTPLLHQWVVLHDWGQRSKPSKRTTDCSITSYPIGLETNNSLISNIVIEKLTSHQPTPRKYEPSFISDCQGVQSMNSWYNIVSYNRWTTTRKTNRKSLPAHYRYSSDQRHPPGSWTDTHWGNPISFIITPRNRTYQKSFYQSRNKINMILRIIQEVEQRWW